MTSKNKNPNTIRRFLVTYADGAISQQDASAILNIEAASIHDAATMMATDAVLSESDIVHFEGMGISSLGLTDKQAQTLQNRAGILAVEEDLEMHALGVNFVEDQGKNIEAATAYQDGYTDAMYEVFKKIFSPPNISGTGMVQIATTQTVVNIESLQQPIPWNINMVKAPAAWARGYRGTGIKVAVLDTGVSPHPDLVISGGISFVPGVTSYNDGHGHGTYCCGIIAARNNAFGVVGVAPECSLYAVKVLSDAGSGSTSSIIAGMMWAKTNGMNVILMALGASSGPSVAYNNAVAQLNASGITVVCAGGASFGTAFPWVGSPANSPGAVAVGAVDANKVIAPFSSRGVKPGVPGWNPITLVAPGINVQSTYKGNIYTSMSGTSTAAAHVAGGAALLKQRHPSFTAAQIKTLLQSSATDLGPVGIDPIYGAGLLNCDKGTA